MKALVLAGAIVQLVLGLGVAICAQPTKVRKPDKGFKVKILKRDRVYYPRRATSRTYKKVGLVSSARVLNSTPEYREIAKKGIKPGSAEYDILVKRASDRFKRSVQKTVSGGGYDLIAETGAVTVVGKSLPDITDTLIRNLTAR